MWMWIAYALTLFICYISFLNWKISNLFKGTPGPTVIPILGNFHNLDEFYPDTFIRLSNKYGPVFRLMFGNTPCAVISDPKLIREAFVRKYAKYSNRPFNTTIKRTYNDGDPTKLGIVFAQYGKEYQHNKRIFMQKLLKKSLVERARDCIDNEIGIAIEMLKKNNEIVVRDVTNQITFNVITVLSMGHRIYDTPDSIMQRLRVIGECGLKFLGKPKMGDYVPWIQLFEQKERKQYDELLQERNQIMTQIIAERKKVFDPSNPKDILDEFLLEGYDDNALIISMMEIFIAGSDTSSILLTWAIHSLAEWPEIQEKLYEDITNGTGDYPYLEAFVMEAHRRYAIAPTFIPHILLEDDTLGSYFLPKGTMVFANWWGVAHSPDLWKNPYEFRPERWLEMTEMERDDMTKHCYFPFSLGPRQCPGMNLAELEIRTVLQALVKEFKFSWSPESKRLSFQDRWEHCVGLAASPKRTGMTCIAEPRH